MPITASGTHNQLDADTLAAALGISRARLCAGLGLDEHIMSSGPTNATVQVALQPVARVVDILTELFQDSESVRAWLRTPHPDLDGHTALETILNSQAQAVCTILENALAGVPV